MVELRNSAAFPPSKSKMVTASNSRTQIPPSTSVPQTLPSPSSRNQPSFSTVVIGKGKVPRKAPGNRRLQSIVQSKVHEYVGAKSKMVKSSIVTNIFFTIEEISRQEGGPPFVRYDGRSYHTVSESAAREKITSTFRDSLHDRYKSSSKNKVAKRRLANKQKAERERIRHHISQGQVQGSSFVEVESKPPSSMGTDQQNHNNRMEISQQVLLPTSTPYQDFHLFNPPGSQPTPTPIRLVNDSQFGHVQQLPLRLNKMHHSYALPPHLSRIDAFADDIFSPVDSSVFDTPLPELEASSVISVSNTCCQV